MIGQSKTIEKVKSIMAGNNYPHFTIINAPSRHGKKTLAKLIAAELGAAVYTPEDTKVDNIRGIIKDAQTLTDKKVYLLAGAENMNMQAQNALLKLAEEPPENAYIIMTLNDLTYTLPTIISRARVIEMEPYSRHEIQEYALENDAEEYATYYIDYLNNIGDVELAKAAGLDKIIDFAEKVKGNIEKVSILNLFNIPQYLEGGSKKREFNIDLFMQALGQQLTGDYEKAAIVSKYKTLLRKKGLNKINAVTMMLLEMRGEYNLWER